jgi:hypothetical protein
VRENLTKAQAGELPLAYRTMRDRFHEDSRIEVLNKELDTKKDVVSNKSSPFPWIRPRGQAGKPVSCRISMTSRCRSFASLQLGYLRFLRRDFPYCQKTKSLNTTATVHDGLFFVRQSDVPTHIANFQPNPCDTIARGKWSWESRSTSAKPRV